MFTFIARLQRKSRYERKLIAFATSAGFTFILFVFWASSMYLYGVASSEQDMAQRDKPTPFEVLTRQLSQFTASAGEIFSDTDEFLSSDDMQDLYRSSDMVEGGEAGFSHDGGVEVEDDVLNDMRVDGEREELELGEVRIEEPDRVYAIDEDEDLTEYDGEPEESVKSQEERPSILERFRKEEF